MAVIRRLSKMAVIIVIGSLILGVLWQINEEGVIIAIGMMAVIIMRAGIIRGSEVEAIIGVMRAGSKEKAVRRNMAVIK